MGLIMRNRKCYTGKVRKTNPLEWKLVGSDTGTSATVNIPSEYNELYALVVANNYNIDFCYVIPKPLVVGNIAKSMRQGYYMQSDVYSICDLRVSTTQVTLNGGNSLRINGVLQTNVTLYLYYR